MVEAVWNTTLPQNPGMDITAMIHAAETGRLKAMYIMGENPVRSLPQSSRVKNALANLEFLVVQDILETETTALAHVVLPGAAFAEKDGSFTNMEGRIQTFAQAVLPPGEAKSDYHILGQIAENMGINAGSLDDIRQEIEILTPAYQGVSTGGSSLWIQRIPGDMKEACTEPPVQIAFTLPELIADIPVDEAYPYTAVIGASHFQAGCGTRTQRSPRILKSPDTGGIQLSQGLASTHGLDQGSTISVISAHGSMSRHITINPSLDHGIIVIPRGVQTNDVMNLFDMGSLESGVTSGWNQCQVRIEKQEGHVR
jgi:predicted molibdopterin-dependent oxidoreductase YjgC